MMVVVAIIAILAGVALTRFAGLLNKSKEGSTRESLSGIRSALNIYYGDNLVYPSDDLSSLTLNGRYLNHIPVVKLPGTPHMDSAALHVGASTAAALNDAGGWAYVNAAGSAYQGTFFVNCSHADSGGSSWDAQ